MNALWFLARKQFKNSLRRAKGSPRLFVPLLFFAFLFLMQVILPLALRFVLKDKATAHRNELFLPPPHYGPEAFVTGGPGTLIASIRGLLFLSILSAIIAALGDGGTSGLLLSPSDVDYLFPAPLARRSVLFFKIAGRWLTLLAPSIYLPLAVASTTIKTGVAPSPLAYVPGVLGVWLFMATVNNATQAVGLWRLEKDAPLQNVPDGSDAEQKHEARTKRRESVRRIAIALVWVVLAAFVYLLVGGLKGLFTSGSGGDTAGSPHAVAVQTFLRAANGRAVSVLLAPIGWASDLFGTPFRGWAWADTGRIVGLLTLFAGSVVALFSRDRDFYENALDTTAKRARMVQAMRQGDAGTVLSQMAQDGKLGSSRRAVRPVGPGAGAVLWKDMVGISRTPPRSWITLLLVAAFPAIFGLLFGRKNGELGILLWMVTFTLQMSGFFLLGMRDMLRRADLSKALPIAPLPFVAAELAFSIVLQTLLGWFSITLSGLAGMGFGPTVEAAYFAFPTLAALVIFVQAIFVLLYPVKTDAVQNSVGNLLGVFASLVSFMPSVLVGLGLYFAQVPFLLIGTAVGGVNLICATVALGLASWLWQRFDPTDG